MSAKTKVAKVRCRCTGGKLENPCDPSVSEPLTPLARAWLAGYSAARSAGLLALKGATRADGAVLVDFLWAYPAKPLKRLIAESPTMGELMRRDEAEKGRQH